MSIIILKRTRATINDSWSDWVETTDPAPFENTDTVEYKIDYATDIKLDDLTNGGVVSGDWEGTGIFDVLTKSFNDNIELQYDKGRIDGNSYAEVYLGGMQSIIARSMEYLLKEKQVEANIDLRRQELETAKEQTKIAASQANVASSTEQDKIAKSDAEKQIAVGSIQDKLDTVKYQALKVQADKDYVKEQEAQLIQSVLDNRKIKALDSLADTYGTFGAGGLTMSSDMWNVYFSIVADLSEGTSPASTSVTKVT